MKQHYQKVTTMPPVSPSMNQKIISWSKIPINIITTQQGSEILSLNIAFTDKTTTPISDEKEMDFIL